MKKIILCFAFIVCKGLLFGQLKVNLTILDAPEEEGKIYISLFNSESSYNNRQVFRSFTVTPQSDSSTITMDLPVGEYLFSVYQDSNHNNKLDYNLIGIPKEKFGFSNYNGKLIPGNFADMKVRINESLTAVVLHLFKI